MENFGGTEEDLSGKYITETDEFYADLMDCTTTMKQQERLCLDVTDLSNDGGGTEKNKEVSIEAISDKNLACLDDCLQNVDTSNHLSSSDNALSLSSVSNVCSSAILDNSKNETIYDLSTFLEKECAAFASATTNASEENSISNKSSSSVNQLSEDSELYLPIAFSHSEPIHDLPESDMENDEFLELAEKIPRLDSSCNSKCRDTKYAEMRRKNNFASRRSRQTRKQKEKEMEEKAVALEKENESLRRKEEKLQELVNKLKEMLFNSVDRKNK